MVEETQRRGRRISTIGLFQPLISFIDGLVIGVVKRYSYIKIIDEYIAVEKFRNYGKSGESKVYICFFWLNIALK
jgi:hypothetical protein